MNFLADENVEKPVVDMLRQKGHEVMWMSEIATRTIDDQLLEQASLEKRILLTNDKDFGELIFLQRRLTAGIVLMRFNSEKSSVKAKGLQAALEKYENRFAGAFVVVSEGRVRIRPL